MTRDANASTNTMRDILCEICFASLCFTLRYVTGILLQGRPLSMQPEGSNIQPCVWSVYNGRGSHANIEYYLSAVHA